MVCNSYTLLLNPMYKSIYKMESFQNVNLWFSVVG